VATDIKQILTKYWGYTQFRPLQEDIIQSVLDGKDTLGLMPTGGGKSICFQVPALAQEGICVVVSPLIALMKDQVQNLNKKGISAVAIVSGMNKREIDIMLDNCVYGKIKFLYVSPERLVTDLFRQRFKKMNVNLLAVDEAHCISQWGYDFRPPYIQIAEIREYHPEIPILALTATATIEVVGDIQEKLNFKAENLFQKSFERKNLAYVVLNEESKLQRLLKIANKVKGSGVVYVRNRKKTQETAAFLRKNNISADFYHAGLDNKSRDFKQLKWIRNQTRVIVATNAFGMGIDKPDVRFVVHLDLPDSLEAYFQEAGRGGRDGNKAFAVLLYNDADRRDLSERIARSFPPIPEIKRTYKALGNYFQLAIGSGKNESFDFNMMDFSKRYELKPVEAFSSLKILESIGYLSLSESIHLPSKVKFLLKHNDLYAFRIANKVYDPMIQLLLRSYSGLFEDYVKINEEELAYRCETNSSTMVQYLNRLDQLKVVSYLPKSNSPHITFTTERLADNNMSISNAGYNDRKKAAEARMDAVITYASAEHKCRSQILLFYFGDTDALRCGVCDICLERNKLELSNLEFTQVSNQIKQLLAENPLTLEELVTGIQNSPEARIVKVIQWLMDNDKLMYNNQNKLIWVK
jgi:ATP-dependent DNA helicase RecQ